MIPPRSLGQGTTKMINQLKKPLNYVSLMILSLFKIKLIKLIEEAYQCL